MLLSDRDLKAAIDDGRLVIDPYDPAMVQPSSIDVRLDRYFRVFENHRYPHIDPAEQQDELTRMVETPPGEPFTCTPASSCWARPTRRSPSPPTSPRGSKAKVLWDGLVC